MTYNVLGGTLNPTDLNSLNKPNKCFIQSAVRNAACRRTTVQATPTMQYQRRQVSERIIKWAWSVITTSKQQRYLATDWWTTTDRLINVARVLPQGFRQWRRNLGGRGGICPLTFRSGGATNV